MTVDELVLAAMESTLVFIGPTAAGKDTIMRIVSVISDMPVLVSHTSRPMRPGEIDGVEYHFVSNEEFDGIKMIEKRSYNTANGSAPWQYGLSEAAGKEHGLLVLDWEGFKNFRSWRVEKGLNAPEAVYVGVEKSVAKERQMSRGDFHNGEFERRWESDMEWCGVAEEGSRYRL